DLRRPPLRELVRVEAVPGADVEAALALHVREGHGRERVPQVEPALGGGSGCDIDRVVPEQLVEAPLHLCCVETGGLRHRHGGGGSPRPAAAPARLADPPPLPWAGQTRRSAVGEMRYDDMSQYSGEGQTPTPVPSSRPSGDARSEE